MLLRVDCSRPAETYMDGPCAGRPRKGGESRTSSSGPQATATREATLACLAGRPSGSESSVMFSQAVMRALRKNKTLRYGVPMLLLIVGGSFGLREFSQIRYDAVKIKIDPELEKKLKMNKVSLESEYEKIKDSTFDDWKNIRGPRPWEDPDLLQGRNPVILETKTP
ncbi:LOW QUALITY PROTEIN: cytochrome c oxidase assembly protein COX16 homolog, mitochondrial [Hippopotamus amphibius kiboko]|uniref:LOW QUALITY PROTEIN: cytochrome c oxidase assembly protein COX16 homolog, mitochondrial n=1 Tax=Hippopotamus amphibius kiboko TaxID=575201 RepID=UPI002592789B|nr:LOW QUALITY PROTEIN: cytochrome c oxidase assembly protein COX16 homolog, mitochondrial [Hippopotamus amphibius kiboko]